MAERSRPADGPGVERTITLVDAVVAIAMTLLVLPLVDAASGLDIQDLRSLAVGRGNLLLTFVLSFVVIYAFWTAHGTLYRRLQEGDRDDVPWLSLINLGWLLAVAFLPFPTALIGRELTTGTAPIYLATLFVLSALTLGMTILVHRGVGLPVGPAWLTTAVFAVSLLTSLFDPRAAMYLLLALFVVRGIEDRAFNRAVARAARN